MSEINFNTYIDPNAIEEKSIEKSHLSEEVQGLLDSAVQPDQVSSLAVTGITMNSSARTITNGVVDLGTVITGLTAATTAVAGVVKLSNSTGSTDENLAATPKAVALVSDLAIDVYNKTTANTESINTLRSDFNTLVSGDTDSAITTFNEITKFLEDFNTGETLTEKLYEINTRIDESTTEVENLRSIVNENESVIAGALTNLNTKLDNCGNISGVTVDQQIDDANITNYITNPVFTEELNKKQDKISDLSTIRSNAEKATTAVQPNQVPSLAVTGIKMNGASKGINGTVDLGTVVTGEHLTEVVSGVTTGHTANQLYGKNNTESRSVISDPNEYNHLFKFTGLKNNSTLGLNNEGNYSSVVGVRAWNDSSGGPAHEFAYTQNGKVYHRYGNSTGDTSWQNWKKIAESDDLTQYVTTGTSQNISGVKKFTSNIEIGQGSSGTTSIITNQIDSGELKLYHSGTTKGFIIRTNKKTNPNASIFPLELLTTNNLQSYQYNFPTQTGGTVALSAKINGNVYTPSTTGGTIDLGDNYLTPTNINDEVLFENLEEVTYNELLNLVNTCSLVKGRNYRIIDYITTTTQEDTQSAGKPFDVIVTALSNNTLDENAKVCQPKGQRKTHGGAIYGINGVIKSDSAIPYNWTEITLDKKLKKVIYDYEAANNNTIQNEYKIVRDGYTVNASGGTLNVKVAPKENNVRVVGVEICNATNRDNVIDSDYHLTDITTNNTSLIGNYYVFVPSDGSYFVRLIFIKPASTSSKVNIEIQNYSGHYFNENDLSKWVIKYDVHNDTNKYLWADATNGKGVIYYMKDEFDNECPYDFKNIKFKRTKQWVDDNNLRDPNDELKFNESEKYFYTFDWNGTDDSLCKGTYKCEQNKIERLLSGKQQQLNNNIFLGNGNANNKIGANSKNNVIGVDSYNNEFGVNFQNNIILQKFTYNTIGNGFQNNVCRTTFRYNTIGHLVSGNKFILSFTNNIVGENVKNNTFSGNTQYNTIGAIVQNNDFSDIMYYCNIGTNLTYCSTFPGLHSVTIEPGILAGTSGSPIDLSTIYVNNKPLAEAILNKKTDGQWSNKGILLLKDNNDKYYITSASVVNVTINVLYSELVELRDNSELIPGQKYRITDYITTTSQENTESAGHQFDIIVEALTENTLSEDAKACLHDGDTYFSEHNAKLEAWEIKYSLYNDTDRFDWADTINGKGVIYYMKDEWGNETSYDFKNIMFIRYKLEAPALHEEYSEEWQRAIAKHINEAFENNIQSYIWSGIDENGKYWGDEVYSNNTQETKAFFTFSNFVNDIVTDKSLTKKCYNNIIKDNSRTGELYLNNNIIISKESYNCHYNTFGYGCYSNTFGDSCYDNTFGNDCHDNTFGNTYYSNTFGNYCQSNTFGNSCNYNTFGDGCYSNTFGNNCNRNTFDLSCRSNTFGNECTYNTFDYGCKSNTFGNECDSNTFGNDCTYNTFGNECHNNTFGDDCTYNTFGNSCYSNTFGDSYYNNTFGNSCGSNTFGNSCYDNTFGYGCFYNTFGNGCDNNTFGYGCYSNTFSNSCRYNTFGYGCHSNTFGTSCDSNTFGNSCYKNTFGYDCNYNTFGSGCWCNTFLNSCSCNGFYDNASYSYDNALGWHTGSGNNLSYVSDITLNDWCSNLLLYTTGSTIKNITVSKNVRSLDFDNDGKLPLVIEIPVTNNEYELKIAKNSQGDIKIYCEADLIL